MKYIFSLMILISCLVTTEAQTFTFSGRDTVVNTGTKNLNLTVKGTNSTGLFQVVVSKISGTVAGDVIFQGSVDGTNFVNLDTLATTNVTTQTKVFTDIPVKYPFYRITYTGSGSMSAILSAKAHLNGRT
jgi:hypothetical protein